MTILAGILFLLAAILEVSGDATIRIGLRQNRILFIVIGILILSSYGLVVNTIKWDFSRLLGIYVAVFAVVSVLFGQIIFKETIPLSTWLGLTFIVLGGAFIQFGAK